MASNDYLVKSKNSNCDNQSVKELKVCDDVADKAAMSFVFVC